MPYQGHRFLVGIKHFWMAVRVWKMNLVLEHLAHQKWTKMWLKWGLSWGLINIWQSEWSVLSWGPWTTQKKGSSSQPEIVDTWMLHHDKAPCHTAISVNKFFTKKGIPVVPQPPYLPDLSPCDFFHLPKLKFHLKGCHFGTVETSERSWQSSWEHFHMNTSSTATGSRSSVSSGMWLPKWTNLKGIMLICSSLVNKEFYSTNLITF